MPKALRHFKVDPVFKIDETFYMQAEFMCPPPRYFELNKHVRVKNFQILFNQWLKWIFSDTLLNEIEPQFKHIM